MREVKYAFNEDFLKAKINLLAAEEVLYRVMTLEQFVDMMFASKDGKTTNTLVRPWMWEDPYEKMLASKKTPFNSERWFGQCWSLSEESDSIWRNMSYNGLKRCVKLKVSIENLKQSLLSYERQNACFILSPVLYLNEETIESFAGNATALAYLALANKKLSKMQFDIEATVLLAKRIPFQGENEVRLLVYDKSDQAKAYIWTYDFDINSYVDEVMFDPWTPKYYQKNYINLLKKLGLKDAKKKVKFSKLYNPITNS